MRFILREFTWKDWILSVIFSVLVVLATSNVAIRGNCSYSTCSLLDNSGDYGVDYYLSAETLGLTPTVLIADRIIGSDPSYVIERRNFSFAADTKNENDDRTLAHAFMLYEACLLSSAPLWFVVGAILVCLCKRGANWSKKLGKFLFWSILLSLVILLLGSEDIARLGSGEVNLTIPFIQHLIRGN